MLKKSYLLLALIVMTTGFTLLSRNSVGQVGAESAAVNGYSLAAEWADDTRRYRLPVTINANGYQRLDKPADLEIDFTALLQTAGENGAFAVDSIRVLEVDGSGQILNDAVPFQFDPAAGFDAANNAAGNLVLLMEDQTNASAVRLYHLYFDTVDQGPFTPAAVTPLVTTTDNVLDASFQSFKIETGRGTYYYHKTGGGFSSLDDAGGNDWISYSTASGANGDYRGIPNMVHPRDGGYFHPGRDSVSSALLHQGPLKSTFTSSTPDGNWQVMWEVYPQYAQLSVLKAGGKYWFLYEGTPGGSLDLNSDLVVRSDGTETSAATRWTGDIVNEEWVYFVDPGLQRSLFLVHHEDDRQVDSYYQMQEAMTVFGFGRSGNGRFLSGIDNHLTFGLVDQTAHEDVANSVNNAYQPLTITPGAVEIVPQPTTATLTINIEGLGSVTKDPDLPEYTTGTAVELTALPEGDQLFLGWQGDLSGTANPTTIVMDGDKEVTAAFSNYLTHTIPLTEGWNLVSTYIDPADPNLEQLLDPILSDLLLIRNSAGEIFWPGENINEINTWQVTEAYQIYMTASAELVIIGTPVDPATPIALPAGWNLVAYLRDSPLPAESALASLAGSLDIAKDGLGSTYWPAFAVNQIGDLEPGKGYQLLMLDPAELIYPE